MSAFGAAAVISGTGQSDCGRALDRTGLELTLDACLAAIKDAGLSPTDIDGLATYPGADNTDPGFGGAGATQVIDALALEVDWYLGACETSGQLGPVMAACMAVATGMARHVVCFRTVTESSAQRGKGRAAALAGGSKGQREVARHWGQWSTPFGAFPPNIFAMHAQRYMTTYGLRREQLAQIALNARRNAAHNPKAIYRDPLDLDAYLGARMISTPFCLYDCDVPIDGSTAVVVSAADTRSDLRRPPVTVEAAGSALHSRYTFDQDIERTAVHDAGESLWRRTSLTPADVDVAELYDGFSFFTLTWLEGLGFCPIGEAGDFIENGTRIALDGELPVNTQGGQLSGGRLHGLGMLHEACEQLWHRAHGRQVVGAPQVAVAAAGGGPFAGCLLLTREN
jgi:acetyl-CoA acetyltransferase